MTNYGFSTRMVQSLLTFAIAILLLNGLYHSRKAGVSVAEHYKPYFTWKSSFRNYTKTEELVQNYAKQISVRELMSRPFPKDQTQVPKLLHQSWNTAKLPSKFKHWSMSCRLANPDWEWVLWTDEDNEELIQRHGRWFIDTYYGLQANIYRADAVRNIYMHVFGGVYIDLDFECLRPYSDLFETYNTTLASHTSLISLQFEDINATTTTTTSSTTTKSERKAFLGRMGTDAGSFHSIPNAWMASTPGHPFWLLPLERIQRLTGQGGGGMPEQVTGPIALFDQVREYFEDYHNGVDLKDDDKRKTRTKRADDADVEGNGEDVEGNEGGKESREKETKKKTTKGKGKGKGNKKPKGGEGQKDDADKDEAQDEGEDEDETQEEKGAREKEQKEEGAREKEQKEEEAKEKEEEAKEKEAKEKEEQEAKNKEEAEAAYAASRNPSHLTLSAHLALSPWSDLFPASPHTTAPESLTLLPFQYIYPYSWQRDGDAFRALCTLTSPDFNAEKCKGVLGVKAWGSCSITYWSHSWDANGGQDQGKFGAVKEAFEGEGGGGVGEVLAEFEMENKSGGGGVKSEGIEGYPGIV